MPSPGAANTVYREVPLRAPDRLHPRLCIFSHYDADGRVDPHVLHYLGELARVAEVMFVTSCPDLRAEDLSAVGRHCSRAIFRANRGRDFGGYRAGLERAGDLAGRAEILLANDSVYGPLADLASVVSEMEYRDLDLWGITESWEDDYHLQSYFLAARRPFFASAAFRDFWDRYDFPTDRRDVIARGEIGFSQLARRAGFRLGAFCDYRQVVDFVNRRWPHHPHRGTLQTLRVNPMLHAWRVLVGQFRCPFVKIELLRDNLQNIRDVAGWQQFLQERSAYPTRLIQDHLSRQWRRGSLRSEW